MIGVDGIADGARALGVALTPLQVERLEQFAERLQRWSARHNLIARGDRDRLVSRHLLDSLSLAPYLRGERVLDLGSGAGLPGLPLAIAAPARTFVLLDRSARKLRFAHQAAIELALDNVETLVADARRFRPERLFDTVISRAVMAAADLWALAKGLLSDAGVLLVQCGDPAAIALPADAAIGQHRVDIAGLRTPHWVLEFTRRSSG